MSMSSIPKIQLIQPSRVIHELISKPIGSYIIRASTENDDILSKINNKSEIIDENYVVLSVRVDEKEYECPFMNYRLRLENFNSVIKKLPKLTQECIIDTEDTNWEINPDLFERTYSSIFYTNNQSMLQAKRIYNGIETFSKTFRNDEKNFQHELSILKTLSYFHIVSFYGIYSESEQIKHLVLGDHGESLKIKYPQIKYTDKLLIKQLSTIAYQIACGMIYLEYKNIIHCDLHAGNILIDEYNYVRITDFGHAIRKDENKRLIRNFRPRRQAPECLPSPPQNHQLIDTEESLLKKFSSKSDVWAYGLIFMELIEESDDVYPYIPIKEGDEEIIQFVQHIKINQNIHRQPNDCPDNFYNILKHCWHYNPEDRISFLELRHEMLRTFET